MHTSDEIHIKGAYNRIFSPASHVGNWAEILPHYRYVKVLRERGNKKLVKMSAWRSFVPVTWSAVVTVEPGTPEKPGRILFHHVRGLVRGMDVVWTFAPQPDGGYLVRIEHDLAAVPFPTRILGPKLVGAVVGRGFIGNIAGKTLLRVKQLAEQG